MSYPFILYHKEYAPTGQRFEAASESEALHISRSKAAEGWVDNPAKLGVNVWGDAATQAVAAIASDFKAKRVGAVDDPTHPGAPDQSEIEPEAQAAQAAEEAQESMREQESLPKRAQMEKEEVADIRSDQGRDPVTGDRRTRRKPTSKRAAPKKKRATNGKAPA